MRQVGFLSWLSPRLTVPTDSQHPPAILSIIPRVVYVEAMIALPTEAAPWRVNYDFPFLPPLPVFFALATSGILVATRSPAVSFSAVTMILSPGL